MSNSAYYGVPPHDNVDAEYRYSYNATEGQTAFNALYSIGSVDVYVNGIKLGPSEFTANNGTSIVLNVAAVLDDEVQIVARKVTPVFGEVSPADLTNGLATKADLAGSVVQVISGSTSALLTSTTTSFSDTGLSATISPKYVTSKILVIVNQTFTLPPTSTASFGEVAVLRAATLIHRDHRVGGIPGSSGNYAHSTMSASVLDSPATTSPVVYKVQFASGLEGQAVEVQHANIRPSTITLMEIAQ